MGKLSKVASHRTGKVIRSISSNKALRVRQLGDAKPVSELAKRSNQLKELAEENAKKAQRVVQQPKQQNTQARSKSTARRYDKPMTNRVQESKQIARKNVYNAKNDLTQMDMSGNVRLSEAGLEKMKPTRGFNEPSPHAKPRDTSVRNKSTARRYSEGHTTSYTDKMKDAHRRKDETLSQIQDAKNRDRVRGFESEIADGKKRMFQRQIKKGAALAGTGALAIGAGIGGASAVAQAIQDDSNRLYH